MAKNYFKRYKKIYDIINSRELQEHAHLENQKRKMFLKDIVLCSLSPKGLATAMELRQYFRQKCCGASNQFTVA